MNYKKLSYAMEFSALSICFVLTTMHKSLHPYQLRVGQKATFSTLFIYDKP